jgi:hypothetical protein
VVWARMGAANIHNRMDNNRCLLIPNRIWDLLIQL